MPVVLRVFVELGIMDKIQQQALLNDDGMSFRTLDGTILIHQSTSDEQGTQLLFGQNRMSSLLLEEIAKYPNVDVRFSLRTVGVDHSKADCVRIMAHDTTLKDDDLFFEADYVVGADG